MLQWLLSSINLDGVLTVLLFSLGIVYELRKKFPETEIGDNHPSLLPLCQTLEEIFSKGLKSIL